MTVFWYKTMFHLHPEHLTWNPPLTMFLECQPWNRHCWGISFGPCISHLLLLWSSPHLSFSADLRKLTSPPVMLLGSCYWAVVILSFAFFPPLLFSFWGYLQAASAITAEDLKKVIPAFIISRLGDYSSLDFILYLRPPPCSPSGWQHSRNSAWTQRLLYCCLRFVEHLTDPFRWVQYPVYISAGISLLFSGFAVWSLHFNCIILTFFMFQMY